MVAVIECPECKQEYPEFLEICEKCGHDLSKDILEDIMSPEFYKVDDKLYMINEKGSIFKLDFGD